MSDLKELLERKRDELDNVLGVTPNARTWADGFDAALALLWPQAEVVGAIASVNFDLVALNDNAESVLRTCVKLAKKSQAELRRALEEK